MSAVLTWGDPLVDRLPNSPASRVLLSGSPLQLDGQKHIIGRRMSELCALFARRLKDGTHFAAFVSAPDMYDVMSLTAYLQWVRRDIIEGTSAQGRWATVALLEGRKDIWLITSVTRMRDLWENRLTLADRPLTESIACGWRAGPGSSVSLVRSGDPALPMVGMFGSDAVLQGALSVIAEQNSAPFAVVIDAFSLNKGHDLNEIIQALRASSGDAPIFLLGGLGDTAAESAASDANFPIWTLRAGDVARLDQTESEQRITLGTISQARSGGADQAAQRLSDGIHVDLSVLISPSANRLFMPLHNALQQLERKAKDQTDLLKSARRFSRAALALSVPWKTHLEAVANGRSVGRFATLSVLDRLAALRASANVDGEIDRIVTRMADCGQQIIDVLGASGCVTSKETALLQAAQAAQSNEKPLRIICSNQAAQRAAQRFLSENKIDVMKGCVKVYTRNQLRRIVSAGKHDGTELLLLDSIGYSDGWLFAGISSRIQLLSYALEREQIERQLKFIAVQTQCTSTSTDKLIIVKGGAAITQDREVDATPPRWQFLPTEFDIPGLWPGKLPEPESIESFVLDIGDWMQRAVAGAADDEEEDEERDSFAETGDARTIIGPIVRVLLDTEKRHFMLTPETRVLKLPKVGSGEEPSSLTAREIQVDHHILITQRNNNGDILDRILDRCLLSAELEVARELRRIWQDALAQLERIAEENNIDVLELLKRHGVLVTTHQTVQHWIRGNTVCPRDLESVIAVGEATQRAELMHNPEMIFGALQHMRRVFVAVITKAVEYHKAGAAFGADEIIDPTLKLRRSDLQNFGRDGRVVAVEILARAA